MPLFNRKPTAQKIKEHPGTAMHKQQHHHHHNGEPADEQNAKQNLVFHCQQAQGSPTGLVSNFSNVRELYQRVADCYDFPSDEVSAGAVHPPLPQPPRGGVRQG